MNFEQFNEIYSKAFDDGVLGKEPCKVSDNAFRQDIYDQGYEDGRIAVKINPNFIKKVKQ